MANAKKVKITLVKSMNGELKAIRSSVRGLGLRKIRQSVVLPGTPENMGMANRARHLVKVEEVS